ncbi:MAG: AAA family ATPase, partial [Streptosporangiaceae bacterium]
MISAAELAEQATARILADLGRAHRGVVVDSPPGAGKSTLVVRTAAALADAREHVMVVAQTNEQVDDLTGRLAAARPRLAVGRLAASDHVPSERVARHEHVTFATKAGDLAGCPVVLSTAHKWATVRADATWPWAIVDEAYQMRSDLLLRVAGLFDRALFVGDPGQLDPFSAVQTERWTGLTWDPMQSAVAVLIRHNPDVPVHTLPVSWRLPESAAPLIAEAFYPFTGFRAATSAEQRRVGFSTRPFGKNALDLAVETAAASGWALYELPARHTLRTDAEAVAACAALAARVVQRGALSYSERAAEGAPVTADRVAVGTA